MVKTLMRPLRKISFTWWALYGQLSAAREARHAARECNIALDLTPRKEI